MAMFCTNCGEKLDGQALFCTACGQKTERTDAPSLGTEAATGMFSDASAPRPPLAAAAPRPAPPPQPPRPAAKSGGSKLFVWMGVLVLLLLVTVGLAYVAFQRFIHSGSAEPTAAELSIAPGETTGDPIETPAPFAPEPLTSEPSEPGPAAEEPAPVASPPAPAPVSPQPARPRPRTATPAPAAAPPAVAAPAPEPKPTPAPVTQIAPVTAPSPPPPAPKPVREPATPPPAPKGSKVMLSGAEAYSPPPAPAATLPKSGGVPASRPAPTAGDVFWSGTLKKNQIVTVDFSQGPGGVGGQPLPGKPVRLETFSPVVQITELPGPDNGWKRFAFKATRDAKRSVTLNFHWTLAQ